jgi:hypothetical protein
MGVMATMIAVSVPAMRSLTGAGGMNRAAADLSRTVGLARVYAMANQTYVRVTFSQVPGKGMVAMSFYSIDGTLDNSGQTAMESPALWRQLGEVLVIPGCRLDDTLEARVPSTVDDAKPSDSLSSDSKFEKFRRHAGGIRDGSQNPQFDQYIQFSPSGEARVKQDAAVRYIKIGVDQEGAGAGSNPFIIRLSGSNGTLHVLRKEDM